MFISYSGSDISILVRDAAFGPIRLCQSAEHFFKFMDGNAVKFLPLEEADVPRYNPSQIVKTTLIELKADDLKVPDVSMVYPLCMQKLTK